MWRFYHPHVPDTCVISIPSESVRVYKLAPEGEVTFFTKASRQNGEIDFRNVEVKTTLTAEIEEGRVLVGKMTGRLVRGLCAKAHCKAIVSFMAQNGNIIDFEYPSMLLEASDGVFVTDIQVTTDVVVDVSDDDLSSSYCPCSPIRRIVTLPFLTVTDKYRDNNGNEV